MSTLATICASRTRLGVCFDTGADFQSSTKIHAIPVTLTLVPMPTAPEDASIPIVLYDSEPKSISTKFAALILILIQTELCLYLRAALHQLFSSVQSQPTFRDDNGDEEEYFPQH